MKYLILLLTVSLFCSCKTDMSTPPLDIEEIRGKLKEVIIADKKMDIEDSILVIIKINQGFFQIINKKDTCQLKYNSQAKKNLEIDVKYDVNFETNSCSKYNENSNLMAKITNAMLKANSFTINNSEFFINGTDFKAIIDYKVVYKAIDFSKDDLTSELRKITINKFACLGDCPVYELSLYENGIGKFIGKKFVPKVGEQLFKEDTLLVNSIFEWVDSINFEDLNAITSEEIGDKPIIKMEYNGKKVAFRVSNKINSDYIRLSNLLEEIVKNRELIF